MGWLNEWVNAHCNGEKKPGAGPGKVVAWATTGGHSYMQLVCQQLEASAHQIREKFSSRHSSISHGSIENA